MVALPTVLQVPYLPTTSGGSSAASSVVVLPVTTTSTVVSGLGPLPTVVVPSATRPVLGLPTSGVLGAHTSGLPTFQGPAARPAAVPPVTWSSTPTPTIGSGVVQMMDPAEVEVDVPDKVRFKILNLEYVAMSDLLPESWHCEEIASSCCHSQPQARSSRKGAISRIALWTECFSSMVAIMTTRYPQYVPEFTVYQRTIVRAARNFEGLAWVSYDICYRRKAARCRDLHWSRVDSALYHEAFTGRARSVPRCSLCLSPHHSSGQCAFAPVGSVQVGGQQSTGVSVTPSSSRGIGGGGQWCGLNNRAGADACRFRNCRFPHHCRDCLVKGRGQQSHPASVCPHSRAKKKTSVVGPSRLEAQIRGRYLLQLCPMYVWCRSDVEVYIYNLVCVPM